MQLVDVSRDGDGAREEHEREDDEKRLFRTFFDSTTREALKQMNMKMNEEPIAKSNSHARRLAGAPRKIALHSYASNPQVMPKEKRFFR